MADEKYIERHHKAQHVIGEYSEPDPSTNDYNERGEYIEIVGNGSTPKYRRNARTLDWEGNESLAGGLTLGKGSSDEVTLTPTALKALLQLAGEYDEWVYPTDEEYYESSANSSMPPQDPSGEAVEVTDP